MRIVKECEICGKKFKTYPYQQKAGLGKFCSRNCLSKWQVGKRFSIKSEFKKGHIPAKNRCIPTGEKHKNWKGEKVSYEALHIWVRYWKGKPKKCEHCGKLEGRLEWANIDRKYSRKLEDYISLCKSCHTKYDLTMKKLSKSYTIICG